MQPTLIIIDNYDSFTFNLVQMFRRYDVAISVFRADKITVAEVEQKSPNYIVISPGPKDPSSAGVSVELVRKLHMNTPIFGICLGMQCINEAFGGITIPAPEPIHGKTSLITHNGRGLFNHLSNPLTVARYHSLVVDCVSSDFEITAHTYDKVVMGIAHRTYPLYGVQFHPESFLTREGFTMIENFLELGAFKEPLP